MTRVPAAPALFFALTDVAASIYNTARVRIQFQESHAGIPLPESEEPALK